jgi:uncharacterized protein
MEVWIWWGLACLAVFLIGVTKSGFGSGVGLMIVPMMAIAMGHVPGRGSEAALGMLLPLLVFGDLLAVWQYRHLLLPAKKKAAFAAPSAPDPLTSNNPPATVEALRIADAGGALDESESSVGVMQPVAASATATLPAAPAPTASPAATPVLTIIRRLLPGTAVGLVIAAALLWWMNRQADLVNALMRVEIGVESIALVGLHWWRLYRGVQQRLMREPWRSGLTGGFSAISSTMAHAAGPIVAMYLLPMRLDRSLFVGACAIYFFLLNTAKLPIYARLGQFKHASIGFTLRFIPLVLAGALFGLWLNRRMSDRLFTRIVYTITFLLGWYIFADGILRLLHYPPIA